MRPAVSASSALVRAARYGLKTPGDHIPQYSYCEAMRRFGLTFHHFGLALRSQENAQTFLAGSGYSIGPLVFDPEQKVRVGLCCGDGLPTIELVLPGPEDGPLSTMLRRQESMIYHQGLLAPDPAASLAAMAEAGLQVLPVSPPKPAVLFSGILVSFHYVNGFGLIEFIHSDQV